ncbi:hypothetical protein B0H14DRAFT_2564020 [Mycena olivaceomarginata]|nr:hypothetical protein B0H14DRAFT_2564020 [Mycena olivaceomarginata]
MSRGLGHALLLLVHGLGLSDSMCALATGQLRTGGVAPVTQHEESESGGGWVQIEKTLLPSPSGARTGSMVSKLVVGGGVKSQKEASTATDWQIYHVGFGHQTAGTAYFRCTIELLLNNGGRKSTRSIH